MFTSKLPISTSVRRPTNPTDNRPSNIPVTVRKANLFTPQTKRPYSVGTSTAGKSFTSGTATDKKFQRSLKPAPDRDAQQRMFDNLTDFLRSNAPGFPCPEAKKFFSSVSTTESTRIFEFLLSRIMPDFKVNRLEIDVPEALAILDYPFIRSVTKSSLVSVTTRQAAAGLLHIFDWLARLIPTTDGDEINKDDEPLAERQIVLMNSILYPENADDENRKVLMKMHSIDDASQLDQDLEFVGEEQERLQRQMQEIKGLEQDADTLWDDIKNCRMYEAQMERYLQTKIDESSGIEQEHRDSALQREENLRQVNQLKDNIKSHKLDIDQANREHENLSKLEQTLQAFRDQKTQAESELRLVDGKCQRLLARSHEWTLERFNQSKDLADRISSVPQLESINFDLPQNLETEDDIRTTISCFKTIASEMDPILSSRRSEEITELQQLEATEAMYPAEVFVGLQEELERIERKLEVANLNYNETLTSLKSRTNDLERKASQREQELLDTVRALREKRNLEVQLLQDARHNFTHLLETSKTHLQTYLESHKQRVMIVTKDAKQQAEDWKEAEAAWENKKMIAMKAYTLLKIPLNLP